MDMVLAGKELFKKLAVPKEVGKILTNYFIWNSK